MLQYFGKHLAKSKKYEQCCEPAMREGDCLFFSGHPGDEFGKILVLAVLMKAQPWCIPVPER